MATHPADVDDRRDAVTVVGGATPIEDASGTGLIRVTHRQQLFTSWVIDVLVYIVVLELFVEYAPWVISESITMSMFVALVLKVLIGAIARLEHHVIGWFSHREGPVWRALGLATVFAILFLSKFVVIEVIAIVFGDRVEIGGFVGVVVLVVALILAPAGINWVYRRLGEADSA
jgi:hypothetical protein